MKMDTAYSTETGWLCLDFANTADWHASSHPEETLETYNDLIEWAIRIGLVSNETSEILKSKSEESPENARLALEKARELRESIYNVLSDNVHDRLVRESDVNLLNLTLSEASAHLRMRAEDGGFTWEWDRKTDDLDALLWPIVKSTVDLMTSDALSRVGECADERGCGWLFWDSSRNRSRRWCDMKDCGNRAKVRRHYEKSKKI